MDGFAATKDSEASLESTTVLQRVPELRVNIDSGNNIEIFLGNQVLTCGPHTLALLDAFSKPRTVAEVLERFKSRVTGTLDWTDLIATLKLLFRSGILQEVDQIEPTLRSRHLGFDAAPIHVAMLNDKGRTAAFLNAIREVVQPGDVVVEIGTGTGVLSAGAALAGARHVYTIESKNIGKSAKAVFERNQLSDRITLIEGWSTQVNVPEKCDVLISEIIGDSPFGEQVLEFTLDARNRFLKPNARMVPSQVQVFGLPVQVPRQKRLKHLFTKQSIRKWKSWYGIDFTPLLDTAKSTHPRFNIRPNAAKKWRTLAGPVQLASVNLNTFSQWNFRSRNTVTAVHTGRLDGMVVYFEAQLSPQIVLSTEPAKADRTCSWHSRVYVFPEPLPLKAGDVFEVSYERGSSDTSIDVRLV
jgi:precorrin-6B methylase 2